MQLPTTTATDEADRDARVAVLPIGAFEQHGQFLPLATDAIIANTIAATVSQAYDLFLLPPVAIGCSHEHAAWRGTVSISAATMHHLVTDIATSLRHTGVDKLAVVNAHGGNYVLHNITQEANLAHPNSMTLFPTGQDWQTARDTAHLTTTMHEDMHAGELETSILLHAAPEVVRDGNAHADHFAPDRNHLLTHGLDHYTTSGVVGAPSHGTAEKGHQILTSLTNSFGPHLSALHVNT